jgi:hypothetical protein
MGLSNAEKQRRWRERRNALARASPEAIEAAFLQDVERCERGEMSEEERIALADRLADQGMAHLRLAQRLTTMARRVRSR